MQRPLADDKSPHMLRKMPGKTTQLLNQINQVLQNTRLKQWLFNLHNPALTVHAQNA